MKRKKRKESIEKLMEEIVELLGENSIYSWIEVRIGSCHEGKPSYYAEAVAVCADDFSEHTLYMLRKEKDAKHYSLSSAEVTESANTVRGALNKLKRFCQKYLRYDYEVRAYDYGNSRGER